MDLTRLLVFCISAFIAAIAGGLYGVSLTDVDGSSGFASSQSLLLFVAIMSSIGGIPWNALLAGLALVLIPLYFQSPSTSDWLTLIFGASAILLGIGLRPSPPQWITRFCRSNADPLSRHAALAGPEGAPTCAPTAAAANATSRGGGLRLTNVTVDFRGLRAVDLFESMSVRDNVELGREAGFAGADLRRQVLSRRAERQSVRERTELALDVCGIASLSNIPTAPRRLVEMARTLAGDFDFVLLDEPSAGLSREETFRFADILRRVAYEWRWGVVVIEHNVPLVMDLCEHIYVLDFGKMIFQGNPDQSRTSVVVRNAYLGNSRV